METEVVESLRCASSELAALLEEAAVDDAPRQGREVEHLLRLDRIAAAVVEALRAESDAVRRHLGIR